MISGTPLPAFKHETLPDPKTHLRLLHVSHGNFNQHVECELSTWPIDSAPSYFAISYTWGDPADKTTITVDGRPMIAGKSCEYVLQQAFATKASRHYWIDAICIDQTSVEERNHQVGIMGHIYSRAKHVFACVGPHADDSEYLLEILARRRSFFRTINRWTPFSDHPDKRSAYIRQIADHRLRKIRCFSVANASDRLRVCKAFVAFMQRPYFTRLWILQELHLAIKVSFCCGMAVEACETLWALSKLVEFWLSHNCVFTTGISGGLRVFASRDSKSYKTPSWSWGICQSLRGEFHRPGSPRECLQLALSKEKRSLTEVLKMVERYQCTDTRDRLYGVLSLASWQNGQRPIPDYNKDNFEVATHTLGVWSQDVHSPSLLYQCSYLCKLFDVTSEVPSLRKAIALRSNIVPEADVGLHDDDTSGIPKVQRIWRGIRIRDHEQSYERAYGHGVNRLSPCYMEQEQTVHLIKLRIGSTFRVCAPPDTKVGDWCLLEQWYCSAYDQYGWILRESEEHKFLLVGPAFVEYNEHQEWRSPDKHEMRDYSSFRGWWDSEDFMILAWALGQFSHRDASYEDIQKLVNTRVHASKDSSYFEEILEETRLFSFDED